MAKVTQADINAKRIELLEAQQAVNTKQSELNNLQVQKEIDDIQS